MAAFRSNTNLLMNGQTRQPNLISAIDSRVVEPADDRNDRQFSKVELESLISQFGAFDIDLCSDKYGKNAACKAFCSLANPAEKAILRGRKCYANFPFESKLYLPILKHYFSEKAADPHNTSLVAIFPDWPDAPFWPYVKGMHLVRYYPPGKVLFSKPSPTTPGTRVRLGPIRWPVCVFWDPPVPSMPSTPLPPLPPLPDLIQRTTTLFQQICNPGDRGVAINGSINGQPCSVFLDSGAQGRAANFMNLSFARQLGLRLTPKDVRVTLGDSSSQQIFGFTTATLNLPAVNGNLKRTMEFTVMRMPSQHQVLLGVPWHREFNPDINWETYNITTRRRGDTNFTFVGFPHYGSSSSVDLQYLDADSFATFCDGDQVEEVFLMVLRQDDVASCVGKETSASHLPTDIPATIQDLIKKYSGVFPEKLPEGIPAHKFRHHINLIEGAKPCCRYPYRFSLPELQELDNQLDALIKSSRVRTSASPWGAPVLFAKKKDGGLRMCIDYRALNKLTIKNKYPLPRLEDCLDKLYNAKFITTLDLASGFWQIPMAEEDISKTAFVCPRGQFEWLVMPFGLCNAPSTFQSMMDEVLRPFISRFVVVYMDDVTIYSNTLEEHLHHLEQVFQKFQDNSFYCKPHKCVFAKPQTKFLGFIVGSGERRLDDSSTTAIQQWKVPSNATEVKSFMGFLNHYRDFIDHLSHIAGPLTSLQSPKVEWKWTQDEQHAFETLKEKLCTAPVLRIFNHTKPIRIVTDASNIATGAALMQDFGKGWQPIAYDSSKLNPAQRNYSTYDRELLAIYRAVTKWRHYLLSHYFEVLTDHATLKHLITQPELKNSRRIRWISDLQEYDFDVLYSPGRTNPADPLSRLLYLDMVSFTTSELSLLMISNDSFLEINELHVSTLTPDTQLRSRIIASYSRDPFYSPANTSRFQTNGGLYYIHGRICIPADLELKQFLLREYHEAPYSGHSGIRRTIDAVSRVYFWPRLSHDVRKYVNSCLLCQKNKITNVPPRGLLFSNTIPTRRWEDISIDFIVSLPPCLETGHDAIMTVVDRLSKGAHFIPCFTTNSAQDVANLIIQQIYRLHGLPKSIISDRDSRFTSQFWQALFHRLGCKLNLSSGYHPQTDGQTERANRTIEELIRLYCSDDQRQQLWEQYLPILEFEYNNAVNVSTGYSPFYLWYGQHPHTPATLAVDSDPPALRTPPTTTDFLKHLNETVASAQNAIARAQRSQAEYYDKKRRPLLLSVGDLVFVEKSALPEGRRGNKFSPLRHGPFKVTKKVSDVAYRLDTPATWDSHNVFHVSFLIPARPHRESLPESIIDTRVSGKQRQLKIRYRDFGPECDEWLSDTVVRSKWPQLFVSWLRSMAATGFV